MPILKYRNAPHFPPPRQIRVEVPGWAGAKQVRATGNHEQPWHCLPFSESARYGLEVLYPFHAELRVRTVDGHVSLEAEWGEPPDDDLMWPPFRPFGAEYYSLQLSLDLAAPKGWAVRCEPHPRFFTDSTHSTPLAVPALIRSEWWPTIYFCIFKAPPPHATHVFRKGEPMIAFIVVPDDPNLTIQRMDPDEAAQREMRSRRLAASRDQLASGTQWTSDTDTVFDGTYRNMARAARSVGLGGRSKK